MKKILITGAEGFLGQHLSQSLGNKFSVVASTFDITKKDQIQAFLQKQPSPFDAVLHLAAISNVPDCEKNKDLAFEVNVQGSLNLAEALKAHSPQARFLFFSSAQIYDWENQPELPRTEEFRTAPKNTYAVTKLKAEQELAAAFANSKNSLFNLRLFNHVHKSQSRHFFLSSVYHQILDAKNQGLKKVPLTLGDTQVFRDIGALQDLLSAVERCLEYRSNKPVAIYNICSERTKRLHDLILDLAKNLQVDVEISHDQKLFRQNDPKIMCGSMALFKKDFDWTQKYNQSSEKLIEAFLGDL